MTGGFWDNHSPHKIAYAIGYCRRVAAVEPKKEGKIRPLFSFVLTVRKIQQIQGKKHLTYTHRVCMIYTYKKGAESHEKGYGQDSI